MKTEQKALALVNGVKIERGRDSYSHYTRLNRALDDGHEALCRAIEQHEDFKQRVSFALKTFKDGNMHTMHDYLLEPFIIPAPKPDPVVGVLKKMGWYTPTYAENFRTELDALGFEIREKNDEQ